MANDGGMKSVIAADKNFQRRHDERKKEWKRDERVWGREEEVECIAAMLQCGVCLLAAGFDGEAAGFFVDCFEIDAGLRVE